MPIFNIKDIGAITIRKSKLAKNVVLRISPSGKPSATIPYHMPYYVAKKIVWQKRDWLAQHAKSRILLAHGDRVGTYQIHFIATDSSEITRRVANQKITIKYPVDIDPTANEVQEAAHQAALRAIKNDAEDYLIPQIALLAKKHGYQYKEIRLRNMRSRWGSCSNRGEITLNIWLMTLPPELIEYVCCHELAHLTHHNHSPAFWKAVAAMLPDYKGRRAQIKNYSPHLQNLSTS